MESITSDRKKDHIELAFESATNVVTKDNRFWYEPLLSTHPDTHSDIGLDFLDSRFEAPIWVSSMTGGTKLAKTINENLARACKDFGLGMGLGSCRKLIDDDYYFRDFDVRQFIGSQPLYANLGIAQINELIYQKQIPKIKTLINKLEADGIIVHINPVQEWNQPEGDHITHYTPIEAIEILLDHLESPIIVKEVGQGIGPTSLYKLMQLPLAAIEFGAYGGTNFAKLENMRSPNAYIDPICFVGHDAEEMINMVNTTLDQYKALKCTNFIVSGGVKNYLDGYYYCQKLNAKALYGQASSFLKHAMGDYDALARHVQNEIKGYQFAQSFLRVKSTTHES